MSYISIIFWPVFLIYIAYKIVRSVRIVHSQEVMIVERLGKYHETLHAGIHILIPFIDRVTYIHTLKEQAIEVQPQICITKDNVQVRVDGILYLKVLNPQFASYGIDDYVFASVQLAQTTMRAVLGTMDLDKTFEAREILNQRIVDVIEQAAEPWGIRVLRYEIQNIAPPKTVIDSMEKLKKAELDKKSSISLSEGDRDARINRSQGLKEEAINKSLGERQKRINEAEGRAKEIEAVANATAAGIAAIADSLATSEGLEAMKLQIAQNFIQQFVQLAKANTEVLLPIDLTNFHSIADSLSGVTKKKD